MLDSYFLIICLFIRNSDTKDLKLSFSYFYTCENP